MSTTERWPGVHSLLAAARVLRSPATPLAWLTMTATFVVSALALIVVGAPQDVDDELIIVAVAFGLVAALWSAVVIVAVFVPVVVLIEAVIGRRAGRWFWGIAGVMAAVPPALLIFQGLHRLFGIRDAGRPLWDAAGLALQHLDRFGPLLLSLLLGGALFCVVSGRRL